SKSFFGHAGGMRRADFGGRLLRWSNLTVDRGRSVAGSSRLKRMIGIQHSREVWSDMRVVCALLVLLVFAPIDQGLARNFKISHQWPAETDARDRAARIFAREVEKRIPGVSIQVYPQLSLKMKAEEQFEALQAGT